MHVYVKLTDYLGEEEVVFTTSGELTYTYVHSASKISRVWVYV